jgi:hypothetical protein
MLNERMHDDADERWEIVELLLSIVYEKGKLSPG